MKKIYLDDVRTPIESEWIVVRSFAEFQKRIEEIGLLNIETISLDHDLGPESMKEYFTNVSPNYTLNYANIPNEKTGMDCAKWLIQHWYDTASSTFSHFPTVYTHSANPVGSANIMGYINNFLMNRRKPQSCIRVLIPHTIKEN